MDVQITTNLAIITPSEEMLFMSNAEELKKAMLSVYDNGVYHVILDLKNVRSIDSTGLGKILVFNKRLRENQGSLKIRNVNSSYVQNLFTILKLPEIIEIEGM